MNASAPSPTNGRPTDPAKPGAFRRSGIVNSTKVVIDDASPPVGANDIEVFGPVATLCGYEVTTGVSLLEESQAVERARRGQGSLVVSVHSNDEAHLARVAPELTDNSDEGCALIVSYPQDDSLQGECVFERLLSEAEPRRMQFISNAD